MTNEDQLSASGHETVLKSEAVAALVMNPMGTFVDCTYGRGGHAGEILARLTSEGRLLVIDKDLDALADARQRFAADERVSVVHGSFADIADHVKQCGYTGVDGVLLDLGVSSPQLDEACRGFSFGKDGPLDMRMDQSKGMTAAEWLNSADEADIIHVLRVYGEERFARRIASAIVSQRTTRPLSTTSELVELIDRAVPRKEKHKHPATRSFQAIRIKINNELDDIEACLQQSVQVLQAGGRLVVISFHSLEDRLVKRFMRDLARGEALPSRLPIRDAEIKRTLKLVGKAVKPSEEEVQRNRRSRSSIMRVAEKLAS
ncbi:MAG: 16S rRNA (cytosine(1402)-N(4))-methyltransferase RsmH [Pseudomonadales bacterium]|nr:16S rRNA (cytosine(1402)-N(4))-methyltransferase RsmH [Pseudomonadales bacterium]